MATKINDLKSFVVYETFYDSLRLLDDKTRLRFYDLIFQYGLYETFPDDITPLEASFMNQIAFSIDRAKSRRKVQSNNGSNGGAPEGNQNAHKDKKCSACIYYRKCTKSIIADSCEDYSPKIDKNKNNPNQTKTNENNLYVNDNVNANVLRATSLNETRSSADAEVSDEEFNESLDILEQGYKLLKEKEDSRYKSIEEAANLAWS